MPLRSNLSITVYPLYDIFPLTDQHSQRDYFTGKLVEFFPGHGIITSTPARAGVINILWTRNFKILP